MFLDLSAKFRSGKLGFRFSDQEGLDHIANMIKKTALYKYEAPFPMLFANLARTMGGYFFDVGANTGIYSLLVASADPWINVVAFEPLSHVRKMLEVNVEGNVRLKDRIKVSPVALSDKTGEFTFYETINDRGLVTTSSSFEHDYAKRSGDFREVTISATTLTAWQRETKTPLPTFMKIDVEGHEPAVLQGAEDLISSGRPIIIIELLGPANFPFFENFLFRQNYLDIAFPPKSAKLLDQPKFVPGSWNHIFCPIEKRSIIEGICRAEKLPFG